jgi:hypothetical protein
MRRIVAVAALLLSTFIPSQAQALQTEELVALAAMPLAVAAAAETTGVPVGDIVDVVTVLNDAYVPPAQFIEVVRYAPAAVMVDTTPDPFVVYLRDQYDSGLRGPALVSVVENRFRTYDLGDVDLTVAEPGVAYYQPVTYYEPATFFPPVVQTRITTHYVDTGDLLAMALMPLAVSAVSDLAGVPHNDLVSFVQLLNAAAVPAPQFVEVVRYSPAVLLVEERRSPFVVYLQDRYDAGLRGDAFVTVIESRLRTYDDFGNFDLNVTEPRIVTYQPDLFFPPVVRTRYIDSSSHPHGGPPGQLKKEWGLQTGAEVVHGSSRGRSGKASRVERTRVDRSSDRVVRVERDRGRAARVERDRGKAVKVDRDRGPQKQKQQKVREQQVQRNDRGGNGAPGKIKQDNRGKGGGSDRGGQSGAQSQAGGKGKGKKG